MSSQQAKSDAVIPSWDGSNRTWRRYCKEVGWFVGSTKASQRRYAASKLISRLTGSARLLAMSWSQREFDGEQGVTLLLRRLASSPLVRRSLPNAAAIMNEYFGFRKRPNETIGQFLVRETLGFEEFQEALLQLKDERDGIDPAERIFDLPELSGFYDDDDNWNHWQRRDDWRGWQRWSDRGSEPGGEAAEPRPDTAEYEPVPQSESKSDQGRKSPPADPDPSPARSIHRAASISPKKSVKQDPLSPMDTFILDVLRGWRLLVAASLSSDEWRDVLATTNNKLDYLSVSDALQTLWDEQMGAGKWTTSSFQSPHQHFWAEGSYDGDWSYDNYQAWQGDWPSEDWNSGEWNDWEAQAHHADESPELNEEPDDAMKDALEAERAAEALALEARRTWAQAQQATANLRRDRGFGKSASSSSGKGSGCFICGGPHLQKDCPDRGHPSLRKGSGKHLSQAELDAFLTNRTKGGKGFKGKFKDGMSSVTYGSWPYDGFAMSKGKGKHKGKSKPSVNMYGMDFNMDYYPMEMMETIQNPSTGPRTVVPLGYGMLDCGATASAGPEASAKKLISHLRMFDASLLVELNYERRPFFRYGSGKWGQALYHAVVTSSTSPYRSFEMYVLENPPEFYESWYTEDMLVPILVGMDHLRKTGLILDFCDGHAVHGNDPQPVPYKMEQNFKGHFMVNIVNYMFGSTADSEAAMLQQLSAESFAEVPGDSEWPWFELAMHQQHDSFAVFPEDVGVKEGDNRRMLFDSFVHRRLSIQQAEPSSAAPGPQDLQGSDTISPVTHGAQDPHRGSLGSSSRTGTGSRRSPMLSKVLALFQQARELRDRIQQSRPVEELRDLRSSDVIHSPSRQLGQECAEARHEAGDQCDQPAGNGSSSSGQIAQPCSLRAAPGVDGDGSENFWPEVSVDAPGRASDVSRTPLPKGSEDGPKCFVHQHDSRQEGGVRSPRLSHGGGESQTLVCGGGTQGSGSFSDRGSRCRVCDPSAGSLAMMTRGTSEDYLNLTLDAPENVKGVTFDVKSETESMHGNDVFTAAPSFEDVQAAAVEIECMMSFNSLQSEDRPNQQKNPKNKKKKNLKKFHASLIDQSSTVGHMMPNRLHNDSEKASSGSYKESQFALPWKILKATMTLLTMLTLTAQTQLRDFLHGEHVDGWELFCAPESWLTSACRSEGLRMSRINLQQGFDLYRHSTYDMLREKYRRERPKRLWVSTRCTYWCPFTSLNFRTEEEKARLAQHRRRERAMFRLLIPFLLEVLEDDDKVELFWEWPTRCYGWDDAEFLRLVRGLQRLGKDWNYGRVDGCRYGLKSAQGNFLKKSWSIGTTSQRFYVTYKSKTCTGCHDHDRVQGVETAKSAYYPWNFCKSIAQLWRSELYPEKWLHYLHAPVPLDDPHEDALQSLGLFEFMPLEGEEPSEQERTRWNVQLLKYHRAAGHPNNYNLARILRDAGRPKWQVQAAYDLRCEDCAALKLGGESSGKIPPASMRPLPAAWEVVGLDVSEWHPPGSREKHKIVVFMDLATKFKCTSILKSYDAAKMESENSEMLLQAFTQLWLQDKPKPKVLVPDNSSTMISQKMKDTLSNLNILVEPPAAKESWAHGLVERAIQEVKDVASKIYLSNKDLSPQIVFSLATYALNSTEFVQGFTPVQWVYGRQETLTEEDERSLQHATSESPQRDFTSLLQRRQFAEDVARKVKAQRTLTKLNNSKVRQPLQVFHPMDLVKIWRKQGLDKGPRGGMKKTSRPQWLGPGRVVFHEILHDQHAEDSRRHIVWVIVAGTMHRCSVHSVRRITSQEKLEYELHSPEKPDTWKSLSDMLPKRSFIDMTDEEPAEDEEERPFLPDEPDSSTQMPRFRHSFKSPPDPDDPTVVIPSNLRYVKVPSMASSVPVAEPLPVNDYTPTFQSPPDLSEEVGNDRGIGSGIPSDEAKSSSSRHALLDDSAATEPENKKPRTEAGSVTLLDGSFDMHLLDMIEELYVMEVDIDVSSSHQMQKFVNHPSLYLAQKLRDCEVRLEKLRPEHRELFKRAKLKEVNSFLQNQAVRRCENALEEQEARSSGRLMRCRWVLTWKHTPAESLQEAQQELQEKPESTTLTKDASKKAKARIVLLGFEHPDLLSEDYKTASPVQSVLTRNLSYQLVMQNDWDIEGIDMSTAFLQTLPSEESKRLWTTGVSELRQALNIPENGVMRILKDFYGSTTAPRNLWKNVDDSLQQLNAIKIKCDACFWLWRVPEDDRLKPDDPNFRWKTLGFMAGHVDDFHRSGDMKDPRWLKIRSEIDRKWKWGLAKKNEYRHAGTDLHIETDPVYGRCLIVDQNFYIEMLEDVQIDPQRFSQSQELMKPNEITACRGALGALQWVAVQTQPLLCARCNLLLTELAYSPKIQLAQEIQEMIKEVRQSSTVLKFFKLPKVKHWTEMVFVGLGDQAHLNRPKGGSTGGLLIFLSNSDMSLGLPAPMILVSWRSWKLQRVAIGTNDAEVQSLVEAEDVLFRSRLLWVEINGGGTYNPQKAVLEASELEVCQVTGLLVTDSKGGYDSIIVNESPLLGLSNTRAALQAWQLKEALPRCGTRLMWLASDWNLADCMTKKKPECRTSMSYFFKRRIWMLKFDPNFVQSSRKEKKTKGSPIQQLSAKAHGVKSSENFSGDASHLISTHVFQSSDFSVR